MKKICLLAITILLIGAYSASADGETETRIYSLRNQGTMHTTVRDLRPPITTVTTSYTGTVKDTFKGTVRVRDQRRKNKSAETKKATKKP